jgi:hypothetical protein
MIPSRANGVGIPRAPFTMNASYPRRRIRSQAGRIRSQQRDSPMTIDRARLPRTHQRRYPAVTRRGQPGSGHDWDAVSALKDDLCRALHMWPCEVDLATITGRAAVTARLARALRVQRRHAITGHWSYDFSCHANLLALNRRVAQLGATRPRLFPDAMRRV